MAENNNLLQALQSIVQAENSQINTAVNGIIESYSAGIACVKPIPQKRFNDGSKIDYPVIPNVPVMWPRFAGDVAGVKGPVRPGDKCLLVFCQQAVDDSDDERRFSLTDAYCIVGGFGAAKDRGAENDQMQLYFGEAYVALTEDGKLLINAPAGVEITTPETLNKGLLTTEGKLSYQAGMSGTGGATINGTVKATGDVQGSGISLIQHTHREHDGPSTGSAQ
ncbi:baseplate assembly protein [Budviciaceae bacterium BWR-B9]|uniref:Baseplate assembly protein n=1 Tax=Limnobaculum allomyrinae TaxID=2791986 RepID=A0ABS1INQ5_9GAMM|nr:MULTISPECIES: Gp138 family membrane-puncturing spike protein [Limnobaculum]MBK5143384.1 baseplate assembly protein [Limnobaculum allomyrinae]MBV7691272.1 baseplate assembly protein [Limnobaculum sp. M2-1]